MITLVVMGIYTIGLIYTIHHYEAAVKQYRDAIEDYRRALTYAKNSTQVSSLDAQNKILQNQVEMLKLQNSELRSGIHTGFMSPSIWETQVNFE